MNIAQASSPLHFSHAVYASDGASGTFAATGAETVINGQQIDLDPAGSDVARRFRGVEIDIPLKVISDSGVTMAVGLKAQHRSATSGAGSTWADQTAAAQGASTFSKTVGNTGTSTDETNRGMLRGEFPIVGSKRYLRIVLTPTPSTTGATGSSFEIGKAVARLVGPDRTPASG